MNEIEYIDHIKELVEKRNPPLYISTNLELLIGLNNSVYINTDNGTQICVEFDEIESMVDALLYAKSLLACIENHAPSYMYPKESTK